MKKYEIEYEVIGHHHITVEVPDGMSTEDIEENHECEEYHGDPIEECIITSVNEIEESA